MAPGVADLIYKIVQTLAKGADRRRMSPFEENELDQDLTALLKHDDDEFVRLILTAVKSAHAVLTPDMSKRLEAYQ